MGMGVCVCIYMYIFVIYTPILGWRISFLDAEPKGAKPLLERAAKEHEGARGSSEGARGKQGGAPRVAYSRSFYLYMTAAVEQMPT